MKKKFLFLLLFSLFVDIVAVNYDPRHKNRRRNFVEKSTTGAKITMDGAPQNFCYYEGYKVHNNFFDFVELTPMRCDEFLFFVINHFAYSERKDLLKVVIYSLSPEEIWAMLHSQENFNCDFIDMINAIYDKEEFILIYKTRMTIEFIIFAFDIKEKKTQYYYSYFKNVNLRDILVNLAEFITKGEYLIEEKFTKSQIDEFKKFLQKYIDQKSINRMFFLNELKAFKKFLNAFLESNNDTLNLSYREQFGMINRFMSIVK